MNVLLTDYLPLPNEVAPADILDARQRLVAYLAQFWPELDTRPNSAFGDLHALPLAVLMAAMEAGMARLKSDLDLSQVIQGKVYDDAFVRAFLTNFGVASNLAVAATGVIRLVFNDNRNYSINLDASFTFGAQVFKLNANEGNPVVVYATGTPGVRYVITGTGNGLLEIYLPVSGPPRQGDRGVQHDRATAGDTDAAGD